MYKPQAFIQASLSNLVKNPLAIFHPPTFFVSDYSLYMPTIINPNCLQAITDAYPELNDPDCDPFVGVITDYHYINVDCEIVMIINEFFFCENICANVPARLPRWNVSAEARILADGFLQNEVIAERSYYKRKEIVLCEEINFCENDILDLIMFIETEIGNNNIKIYNINDTKLIKTFDKTIENSKNADKNKSDGFFMHTKEMKSDFNLNKNLKNTNNELINIFKSDINLCDNSINKKILEFEEYDEKFENKCFKNELETNNIENSIKITEKAIDMKNEKDYNNILAANRKQIRSTQYDLINLQLDEKITSCIINFVNKNAVLDKSYKNTKKSIEKCLSMDKVYDASCEVSDDITKINNYVKNDYFNSTTNDPNQNNINACNINNFALTKLINNKTLDPQKNSLDLSKDYIETNMLQNINKQMKIDLIKNMKKTKQEIENKHIKIKVNKEDEFIESEIDFNNKKKLKRNDIEKIKSYKKNEQILTDEKQDQFKTNENIVKVKVEKTNPDLKKKLVLKCIYIESVNYKNRYLYLHKIMIPNYKRTKKNKNS
ncbi:hypothetical protein COBT_003001, partial [Conglomerata obtusa]